MLINQGSKYPLPCKHCGHPEYKLPLTSSHFIADLQTTYTHYSYEKHISLTFEQTVSVLLS